MRNLVLWTLVISLVTFSCKKPKTTPPPNPPSGNSGDVYTVGYEYNGTVTVAKYWKNKVGVSLTDGTKAAQATGIFINGADVYICGFEQNAAGKLVAMYWKNGTPVVLGDQAKTSTASGIAVSGTDVFVVGNEFGSGFQSLPITWVNGTRFPTQLAPNIVHAENNGITVKNGVFYFAGTIFVPVVPSGNYYAQRWSHTLPFAYVAPIDITIDGKAFGIATDGTNMYTCGSAFTTGQTISHFKAYYWENNIPHALTDGSKEANAQAITVSGTDVYVCGYEAKAVSSTIGIAKYWKNGVLTNLGSGDYSTSSTGIAVKNTDVYVSGYGSLPNSGPTHAYLWKNGAVYDSTNSSNAVFWAVAVAQ